MARVRSSQVYDEDFAALLSDILPTLKLTESAQSLLLPTGLELKWGTIAELTSMTSEESRLVPITYPEAFANETLFLWASFTPAVSTDFYGMTSVVTKTAAGAEVVVRNGATAQTVSSGVYFALGR